MGKKLGVELELLVLDSQFRETNQADVLLDAAKNQDLPLVGECSHAMVELNGKPGDTFYVLEDFIHNISKLNELARSLNLYVLPIETPLDPNFTPKIRDHPRYSAKRKLLGEERFTISGKVLGFHTHYELEESDQKKVDQINFLTLMDPPAITISASSPKKNPDGSLFNNWRTYSYRNIVHENLPFQGHLQQFRQSYNEYLEQLEEEFSRFINLSAQQEIDFSSCSTQYNSIWGPVRINPGYQTVEIRSPGANPDLHLLFSLATIIKGGLRRIAEDPSSAEDNAYFKLLLNDGNPGESFEILQALSYDSMQYGLASETVTNFCQNAYDFCKESLTPRELALTQNLDPFISSRKNMSDYIHSLKGSTQDKYSHLHDLYLGSLKTLKGFL